MADLQSGRLRAGKINEWACRLHEGEGDEWRWKAMMDGARNGIAEVGILLHR